MCECVQYVQIILYPEALDLALDIFFSSPGGRGLAGTGWGTSDNRMGLSGERNEWTDHMMDGLVTTT